MIAIIIGQVISWAQLEYDSFFKCLSGNHRAGCIGRPIFAIRAQGDQGDFINAGQVVDAGQGSLQVPSS